MVKIIKQWDRRLAVSGLAVLGFLALLCCGCSTAPQIQYVPQKVEVPVIQTPPPVKVPAAPHLAIQDITAQTTDAQVMAAWVATVDQLKADDELLRTLLEPYSK